jgi:hypothetical protein
MGTFNYGRVADSQAKGTLLFLMEQRGAHHADGARADQCLPEGVADMNGSDGPHSLHFV